MEKIPKTRQQAIELAQRIKVMRQNKFKGKNFDVIALMRLKDMPYEERCMAMARLVDKGYADCVEEVERMLKSKEVCRDVNNGFEPTESVGMSDDRLDSGVQYTRINVNLI